MTSMWKADRESCLILSISTDLVYVDLDPFPATELKIYDKDVIVASNDNLRSTYMKIHPWPSVFSVIKLGEGAQNKKVKKTNKC